MRIFEKRIALLKQKNVPISLVPRPSPLSSRKKIEQFLDYTTQASVPFKSSAYFIRKAFREGLEETGYRNYTPQTFEVSLQKMNLPTSPRAAQGPLARFCSVLANSIGWPRRIAR